MPYYDRWNDQNREARRTGERDAGRGYRSHRFDFDPHTEHGAAYEDGYQEERRRLERIEEERREQEEMEQEHRRAEEMERQWLNEEYYRAQEVERQIEEAYHEDEESVPEEPEAPER